MKRKNKDETKKINYKKNFKEYWNLAKKYKLFMFFLGFLVIISQGFQIGEKYLFQELVNNAEDFFKGIITQVQFADILGVIALIFIVVYLIRTVNEWFQLKMMSVIDTRMTTDLKRKYFNHIVRLHQGFHTTHKTGSMISRLNRGNGAVNSLTESLVWQVSPLLVQLAILIPAFCQFGAWQAIILGLFTIVYIGYSYFIAKVCYEKDRKKENEARDIERGNLADIFTNIESVKLFGKEKNIIKRFKKLTENYRKASYKAWGWWAWYVSGQTFIMGVGMFFLFFVTLKQFQAGTLSLGQITFIYTTFIGLMGPLNRFSWGIRDISRSLNDVQDLFEYGEIKNEIKDEADAKNLNIQNPTINFKNISFAYSDGKPLFKKFNLNIPKNKTIAFVGQSGCGKSSLIKLLYRLYDLDKGEILIDGKDISKVRQESLRDSMSIVPQEAILFDDTIYNNIKFANPAATKKDITQAMRFAQLDEFVNELPKKADTIVGERGVKLSGGQKQRVGIARAILANKSILVLDEATSALDSETENDIQRDLEKLMKNRTAIVIAHRLSTIMKADLIVVMKDGKILQKGTHRELITEGGEYAKLWNFQKGGFIQED